MNAWELPEIEFTETTVFCERCKPYGKCLSLKWLDHKSWLESPYYHNAEADKIIGESAAEPEVINEEVPVEEEVAVV